MKINKHKHKDSKNKNKIRYIKQNKMKIKRT